MFGRATITLGIDPHSSLNNNSSAVAEIGDCGHNRHGAEAYHHTKWHLDPSSPLATTDMGRKLGVTVPLWRG